MYAITTSSSGSIANNQIIALFSFFYLIRSKHVVTNTLYYMDRYTAMIVFLSVLCACGGPRWSETETENGYNLITQKRGQTLGYAPGSGVGILTDDGYAFKDLNRNGSLEPYEDWRLPAEERAEDLASRLTIEQIAGMMLYSSHQSVPSESWSDPQQPRLQRC